MGAYVFMSIQHGHVWRPEAMISCPSLSLSTCCCCFETGSHYIVSPGCPECTMQSMLASDSHRSSCLQLLSANMKGMRLHSQSSTLLFLRQGLSLNVAVTKLQGCTFLCLFHAHHCTWLFPVHVLGIKLQSSGLCDQSTSRPFYQHPMFPLRQNIPTWSCWLETHHVA